MPTTIADAPTATARRKQIAMRGRVDEPGVRFAQLNLPRLRVPVGVPRSRTCERTCIGARPYRRTPSGAVGQIFQISNWNCERWGGNGFGKCRECVVWPSRRANDAGRSARRRRLQGSEIEKRQNKLAPCAPALFIGPSARSASAMPARLPHHVSIQAAARWICARRLGGQIPRLGRCNPRDVFRPSTITINSAAILTSARAEVGQHGTID